MSSDSKYTHEYKHISKVDKDCFAKADKFAAGYKDFITSAKTERECVDFVIKHAKNYVEFDKTKVKELKPNDKFYINNRGKSVVLITIGEEPLSEGVNFVVSHIDSPRLDLKPNPVYESEEISYFHTHYYGGIKKYQWPTIPLSMHGRVYKEDGRFVDIKYG